MRKFTGIRGKFRKSFQKGFRFWLLGLILLGGLWTLWGRFFESFSALVPSEGGVYTESLIGQIVNPNPLSPLGSSFDQDLGKLIFRGLLDYNPSIGKIEGALGEFRVLESGKIYEVTLKEDLHFSNGDALTMDDVLFTFEEIIQNPDFPNEALKKAFEYVTLEVRDDSTIQFILPEPNIFFLGMLTTPILPKKAFENALIQEVLDPGYPFNRNPYGSGPYRLTNLIPENNGSYRVFLERNPYYFATPPRLEQLVFYIYPDVEKLKASEHESTVLSNIPNSFQKSVLETLKTTYKKTDYLLPRYLGFFLNLDRPFLKDIPLRKALFLSLNKDTLLEKEPGWIRVDSPFFFEGIETQLQNPNYTEARNALRDGGFPYSRYKKLRTKGQNGPVVTLKLITSVSPASYSRMAQNIARAWEKELDIIVDVHILEPEAFQEAVQKRDYDILLFGNDFSNNFDSLSAWHSSQSGKLNFSNLTRDDIDFLISEIRQSGAQIDFLALSQKIDEIIPALILGTPQYQTFTSAELLGYAPENMKFRRYSDRFAKVEDWYFFQKKDWNLKGHSKILTFIKWIFGKASPETL